MPQGVPQGLGDNKAAVRLRICDAFGLGLALPAYLGALGAAPAINLSIVVCTDCRRSKGRQQLTEEALENGVEGRKPLKISAAQDSMS